MSDFTHIGRELDPRYPYHRLMVALALVAGAAHGLRALIAGDTLWAAVGAGVAAGLTVGLAWILARELDPDHEQAALVSGALGGVFGTAFPALLPLAALTMATRVVNRSTGLPLRLPDTLMVLALIGAAALTAHWTLAVIGAGAFLLDSLLVHPLRRHRWAALASAVLAVGLATTTGTGPLPALAGLAVLVVVLVIVAFTWLLLTRREVHSLADNGSDLHLERVQAAMALAVAAGLLALLVEGAAAVPPYTALWAALAGPVLWELWWKLNLSQAENHQ